MIVSSSTNIPTVRTSRARSGRRRGSLGCGRRARMGARWLANGCRSGSITSTSSSAANKRRRLSSPQGGGGPVALAGHFILDQMGLELAADERGTVAAHAHEAHAALRQALDRGNADLGREAAADHRPFVEV